MKFKKYLVENQFEEWKYFYIDYKRVKKYINEFCVSKNTLNNNFHELIENEINKVNNFYKIIERYDKDNTNIENFIILNYMACFKLIKKYDKKCSLSREYIKLEKINFYKYISEIDFYKNLILKERKKGNAKLVIFDKDGTLISHDRIFNEWIEGFANNLGRYKIDSGEIYRILKYDYKNKKFDFDSIVPRGTNDDIRNVLQNYLTSKLKYDTNECEKILKDCWYKVELNKKNIIEMGNIKKIFENLKKDGIKIAICTSDDREDTEKCIKILEIEKYLDDCICGDDLISNKPSPEPIWEICRKLNIKPENTLMIGEYDIHSGINARCGQVISVLSGGYENTELKGADIIIDDIDSLLGDNNIIKLD